MRDESLLQGKQESVQDRTTEKLNLNHQVLSTDIPGPQFFGNLHVTKMIASKSGHREKSYKPDL